MAGPICQCADGEPRVTAPPADRWLGRRAGGRPGLGRERCLGIAPAYAPLFLLFRHRAIWILPKTA